MTTNTENQISHTGGVSAASKKTAKVWVGAVSAIAVLAAGIAFTSKVLPASTDNAAAPVAPSVTVSQPLQRDLEAQLQALGQFSATEHVEIRAQVGGTLTQIGFKDGDIVHQGDLLFVVDPTPYQIKLSEAVALRESAKAQLDLALQEAKRAKELRATGAGTVENLDQRQAEQFAAQAALDGAEAQVRDAQFDLDRTRIAAPFTGRIGSHQVSVGNLIAGSRAATSPTTLLASIVSLDPIYLDFDMSEADYTSFLHERQLQNGPLADKVAISLTGDTDYRNFGTLDFVDNALDRASGTIHARATVSNRDYHITPGGFGRVKVAISRPSTSLLLPDAAILQDQSQHMVFIVGVDNKVFPRIVVTGELRDGLRVIRSGLQPTDRVIIDNLPHIRVGETVAPKVEQITADADDTIDAVAGQGTAVALR